MIGREVASGINWYGLEDTIAALDDFAPWAKKELQQEISGVMRDLRSAIAPPPDPAEGRYYLRTRLRGRNPGASVRAADRWSAVFEFAGTRMQNRAQTGPITPRGRAMVDWLNTFGSPGRFLWEAWDQGEGRYQERVQEAMKKAERRVQAAVDGTGGI